MIQDLDLPAWLTWALVIFAVAMAPVALRGYWKTSDKGDMDV